MSSRWQRVVMGGMVLAGVSGIVVRAWPAVPFNAALLTCIGRGGISAGCERALEVSNPRAQYYAGLAAWRSGNASRAVPLLRGALAADPANDSAALVLGEATRDTGDAAGALAIWRQAGAFPYFLQRARSL